MLQAAHARLPQHALLYCHAMPATPWQPHLPVKCADCSHVAEVCAVLALAQPHVSQLGGARGRQQHIGALQCRGGKGQEPRNQQGKRPPAAQCMAQHTATMRPGSSGSLVGQQWPAAQSQAATWCHRLCSLPLAAPPLRPYEPLPASMSGAEGARLRSTSVPGGAAARLMQHSTAALTS